MNRAALKPGLILTLLVLLVTACAAVNPVVKALDSHKKHWQNKDYQWNADQPVECTADQEGCNQIHLIKGDACLLLGKKADHAADKVSARVYYACAAEQLEEGIRQTRNFQPVGGLNLDRAQTYLNLCEALRDWRGLEKGSTAEQINRKLIQAAQDFTAAETGHPGAIYFYNNARLAQVQPRVRRRENPEEVCRILDNIIKDLNWARSADSRGRFRANIEHLQNSAASLKPLVPNCR